jgi:ribosomal RNA-processing protein 17
MQLREERKQELEEHVAAVNAILAAHNDPDFDAHQESGEDGEWDGIKEDALEPIDHEAEYIDEDKYTTVTVEEVDVTKHGLTNLQREEEEARAQAKRKAEEAEREAEEKAKSKKKVWPKKEKKKQFRYESKIERRLGRAKQKAKNSSQAKARKGE